MAIKKANPKASGGDGGKPEGPRRKARPKDRERERELRERAEYHRVLTEQIRDRIVARVELYRVENQGKGKGRDGNIIGEDLEDLLLTDETSISRWKGEIGTDKFREPSLSQLATVSKKLEVEAAWLLHGEEDCRPLSSEVRGLIGAAADIWGDLGRAMEFLDALRTFRPGMTWADLELLRVVDSIDKPIDSVVDLVRIGWIDGRPVKAEEVGLLRRIALSKNPYVVAKIIAMLDEDASNEGGRADVVMSGQDRREAGRVEGGPVDLEEDGAGGKARRKKV